MAASIEDLLYEYGSLIHDDKMAGLSTPGGTHIDYGEDIEVAKAALLRAINDLRERAALSDVSAIASGPATNHALRDRILLFKRTIVRDFLATRPDDQRDLVRRIIDSSIAAGRTSRFQSSVDTIPEPFLNDILELCDRTIATDARKTSQNEMVPT